MTEAFNTAIIQINACEYGETLEFRNGEVLDFYSRYEDAHELRRSGFLYAFKLLRVPEPPGPSPVNVGFTVVCCRQFYDDSEWGWVNLPERTKEAVGRHLRMFVDSPEHSPVDNWIYVIVRKTKDQPAAESLTFKATGIPYPRPFWLRVDRLADNAENYTCSVDLATCPVTLYKMIVHHAVNDEIQALLRNFGFLEPGQISILYKEPN